MKLEPGKYYKTRNGCKVFIIGIAPDELKVDPRIEVVGYMISREDLWFIKSWDRNGAWDPARESCHDLVSEWTEPEEVEITIYRTPGGNILVYQGEPMEGQEDMFKIVKKLKVTLD